MNKAQILSGIINKLVLRRKCSGFARIMTCLCQTENQKNEIHMVDRQTQYSFGQDDILGKNKKLRQIETELQNFSNPITKVLRKNSNRLLLESVYQIHKFSYQKYLSEYRKFYKDNLNCSPNSAIKPKVVSPSPLSSKFQPLRESNRISPPQNRDYLEFSSLQVDVLDGRRGSSNKENYKVRMSPNENLSEKGLSDTFNIESVLGKNRGETSCKTYGKLSNKEGKDHPSSIFKDDDNSDANYRIMPGLSKNYSKKQEPGSYHQGSAALRKNSCIEENLGCPIEKKDYIEIFGQGNYISKSEKNPSKAENIYRKAKTLIPGENAKEISEAGSHEKPSNITHNGSQLRKINDISKKLELLNEIFFKGTNYLTTDETTEQSLVHNETSLLNMRLNTQSFAKNSKSERPRSAFRDRNTATNYF